MPHASLYLYKACPAEVPVSSSPVGSRSVPVFALVSSLVASWVADVGTFVVEVWQKQRKDRRDLPLQKCITLLSLNCMVVHSSSFVIQRNTSDYVLFC